jgi:hypothetical protein
MTAGYSAEMTVDLTDDWRVRLREGWMAVQKAHSWVAPKTGHSAGHSADTLGDLRVYLMAVRKVALSEDQLVGTLVDPRAARMAD